MAQLHEDFLKELNWTLVEEFMDFKPELESNKKSLTLREFKELISNGSTITDLIAQDYSNKLLSLFTRLLKGKIQIKRDTLYKEHVIDKQTLEEISTKYNIEKDDIAILLKMNGIKPINSTKLIRQRTDKSLSQRQIEIMYGSMLGDAGRLGQSNLTGYKGGCLKFKQGTPQKDYLIWKYNEFSDITNPDNLKHTSYVSENGTECVENTFFTKTLYDIEQCIDIFYKNGEKDVYPEAIEKLSALSLAVWFMDDGKTGFHEHKIIKTGHKITPTHTFCTDSFSGNGVDLLINWLKDKFGILARKKEKKLKNSIGYRIIILPESNDKFIEIIKPYILPMFNYKIDYNEYLKHREQNIKNNPRYKYVELRKRNEKVDIKIGDCYIKINIEEAEYIFNELHKKLDTKTNEKIIAKIKELGIKIKEKNNATITTGN